MLKVTSPCQNSGYMIYSSECMRKMNYQHDDLICLNEEYVGSAHVAERVYEKRSLGRVTLVVRRWMVCDMKKVSILAEAVVMNKLVVYPYQLVIMHITNLALEERPTLSGPRRKMDHESNVDNKHVVMFATVMGMKGLTRKIDIFISNSTSVNYSVSVLVCRRL